MELTGIPVDVFGVPGLNRERWSPFDPPGLQNFTSRRCTHSCSKAMHASAAAFFGLVCSLWHCFTLSLFISGAISLCTKV